ncbi:MAG TPA: DNA translocase FtsK 4TM domain-containing protein, partial [Rhodanobacter sp.]
MARSTNVKQQPKEGLSEELKRRLREAGALLLLPLALYLLVCLFSYNAHDPSWTNASQINLAQNFGGTVGAHIADLLRWIFGLVAYCFPLLLLLLGVQVLRQHGARPAHPWEPSLRLIGFVFFFITGPALLYLNFHDEPIQPQGVGGIIGVWVGDALLHAFGDKGAPLLLLALFLVAVTLATGLSWFRVMDWTGQAVLR